MLWAALAHPPQRPLRRRPDEVDADSSQSHVGAVPDGEGHLDASPRPRGVVPVLVLAGFLAALSTRVERDDTVLSNLPL